jgi:hypothetical protein
MELTSVYRPWLTLPKSEILVGGRNMFIGTVQSTIALLAKCRRQFFAIALSGAVLTFALACGNASSSSNLSSLPASSASILGNPQLCTDNGPDGFITSYVTCMSEQLQATHPVTIARVGSNMYVAYRLWRYANSTQIAVFPDNGKSFTWPSFGVAAQPQNLTIAEYQGNLYAGYTYLDQKIKLQRATLDAAGNVTGLVFVGGSDQTTDAFPTLSSSQSGLLMAWQTRHDPPYLGFSKFALPVNPNADMLLPGAIWYPQFRAKTRPSIAVIESKKTIYVAYETGDLVTQVVAISEDDGKTLRGQFTSPKGFRAPTIAAVGDNLFLVYCWYQNSALNITQVMLNPDGIPTGFGPTRASNQGDGSGADLLSTPGGLVMAWKWAPHSQELRIGSVR